MDRLASAVGCSVVKVLWCVGRRRRRMSNDGYQMHLLISPYIQSSHNSSLFFFLCLFCVLDLR